MYYKKELKRGYNQSKLLAKELGKELNIKVINTLVKVKENRTQSTLLENERKENVKNVFEIIKESNIENKNIILVDDILTTGSTIRTCSKILKENGAKKICALTMAKTYI